MSRRFFRDLDVPVREDLATALETAWTQLGEPGSWLDGGQRLAVAAEARHAKTCALCRRRKAALSPYTIEGEHDTLGVLNPTWIDVVHRVVTDSGRISERWYRSVHAAGVSEDEYVELVSVAVLATCVDAFARGIGMRPPPLPDVKPGAAAARPCDAATPGPGWVASVAPENAGPELQWLYAQGGQYIRRALSRVPGEARRFWNLMHPLYLSDPTVDELDGVDRAISRAQMEFLAARVSALHDCFY